MKIIFFNTIETRILAFSSYLIKDEVKWGRNILIVLVQLSLHYRGLFLAQIYRQCASCILYASKDLSIQLRNQESLKKCKPNLCIINLFCFYILCKTACVIGVFIQVLGKDDSNFSNPDVGKTQIVRVTAGATSLHTR